MSNDDSSFVFDDMPVMLDRQSGRGGGGGGPGGKRSENIVCYLKPTSNPKEPYVFRLLSFHGKDGVDRKTFYIARYVHTMWATNANGKRFPECTVICPVSSHVSWVPRNTNRYDACPICVHANKAFAQFKQSGYTNKEASKINNEFGRKFEGLIPVFVVKDPNNPANNGKLRVLLVSDKKKFDEIMETVKVLVKQGIHIFNGGEAFDLCMLYGEVEHKSHEGQPNEKVWKKNEITKFKFSKTAYEIPAITKDALMAFPFDEQYYVESSPEELKEFYSRYCAPPAGRVDVDFDDDDEGPMPPAAKPAAKAAPPPPPVNEEEDDFGFDTENDAEEVEAPPPVAPPPKAKVKVETEVKVTSADSDLKELESELDEFFDK